MLKIQKLFSRRASEAARTPENGENPFKRADGERYTEFMARLHGTSLFDWYLEVGCREGRLVSMAQGKTIAVDPFFRIDTNVIGRKPALHVFQQTSDQFFASGFLEKLDISIAFSFLDGMHLFEYLLRDFINTERVSHRQGVIALHDCCPYTFEMTTRDIEDLPEGAWTGDVWKLIPILREYRPDLTLSVLDAKPTGIVVISGLDPDSSTLASAYDGIVQRYLNETLESFGLDRFNGLFEYTSAKTFLDNEGRNLLQPLRRPESSALEPKRITP